jgi:hypothetical protein
MSVLGTYGAVSVRVFCVVPLHNANGLPFIGATIRTAI